MSDPHSAPPAFPPELIWRPLIEAALREDLGSAGDLTTDAVAGPSDRVSARIVSRSEGCLAGLPVVAAVFDLLGGGVAVEPVCGEGERVAAGDELARLEGPARTVLCGERTALNFLGRLSGVATATRQLSDLLEGTGTAVVCTRKTTPGLRSLEKYAVRAGGGSNHRFGLGDAVLIKDNHVALAGGVGEAIRRVQRSVGHMVKVEVEVDTLEQLAEALEHTVDAVLLDNMSVEQVREAVSRVDGRMLVEVSGGLTPERAGELAAAGVDLISVGWLTHSAPALDVSLEVEAIGG